MDRRNNRQFNKKREQSNKPPGILSYFKDDIVKSEKKIHPRMSDDEIAASILSHYQPSYFPYIYTLDVTEEFKTESESAKRFMFEYLTSPCETCPGESCFNWHTPSQRRRVPCRLFTGVWNYIPTLCTLKKCDDENCEFSHNSFEVNYHPMKYKTMVCAYPLLNNKCKEFSHSCHYSHGDLRTPSSLTQKILITKNENEGRFEMIPFSVDTFKTLPCKQTLNHDKASCNFFHNDLSDRRRDPNKFSYSSSECPKAFGKELLCKFKDTCKFAHNEVEKMYHKDVYNTIPCKDKQCKLQEKCPYNHDVEPELKENVINEWKKYKEDYENIKKEIELTEVENEEFQCFKCIFCGSLPGELILACGHLTCKECEHGDSCGLCYIHIKPIIELKFN